MSSGPPTVLIFTYAERGQANVCLAISYELARAGANVHIASFSPLRTRVTRVQELVDFQASRSGLGARRPGSITFRECKWVAPSREAQLKFRVNTASIQHAHGVRGALESYPKMYSVVCPWGAEGYRGAIANCKEIIASVKPDIVGTDILFLAAQDACRLVDQRFVIISPAGLKEAAAHAQPCWAAFWKYPALSSGFPFPLKWWQIPLNVYLYFRLLIQPMFSPSMRDTETFRRSLGLNRPIGIGSQPGVTHICPATTEIDFLFSFIPEEVRLCGPIVIPFDELEESDSALKKWLDNGPTVLVNLGSHMVSDEKATREMASAFRILLDYHYGKTGSNDIQVLWKIRADGDVQSVIDEIVGKEVQEGKVRVVPWLDADPISILQHPNVICTVHHGGANSFYEGVWSGVPHVVLPIWFDTYDFAQRAEFLNIGIFGNKISAPHAQAEEFGRALVRITGNSEDAIEFRTSAKHLKDICRAKGSGRELASVAILREIGERG